MAYSHETYTYDSGSNPSKQFSIPFGYLDEDHLTVYVNEVALLASDWSLASATLLQVDSVLVDNDIVQIARSSSPAAKIVDWVGSGLVTEDDLDNSDLQWLYLAQELIDRQTEPNIADIGSDYTIKAVDDLIIADCTAGNVTITLPAASGSKRRQLTVIRKDNSVNNVIVDGNAAETINGSTTYTLADQYDTVRIVCDGTEWFVMSEKGA